MATRKPVVYCPICGSMLEFEATTTESTKPGKTHWLVKAHTCPADKVQQFVNGLGIDAEVESDDGSSDQVSAKPKPYTRG